MQHNSLQSSNFNSSKSFDNADLSSGSIGHEEYRLKPSDNSTGRDLRLQVRRTCWSVDFAEILISTTRKYLPTEGQAMPCRVNRCIRLSQPNIPHPFPSPLLFLVQKYLRYSALDITLHCNNLVMFLREIRLDHTECGITASDCYLLPRRGY
jgi:hypothetical protein